MRWSSHHARLKRTSAVFCQSLTLPHELRSRYGRRKKDYRTTRCNGCVARTLLKICVFLRIFLPPALHYSRKISMFSTMKKRRFSGTLVVARVPIGCWREDAQAGGSDWSHITAVEKERRPSGARSSSDFKRSLLRRITFSHRLISLCSTKSSSHTRRRTR